MKQQEGGHTSESLLVGLSLSFLLNTSSEFTPLNRKNRDGLSSAQKKISQINISETNRTRFPKESIRVTGQICAVICILALCACKCSLFSLFDGYASVRMSLYLV